MKTYKVAFKDHNDNWIFVCHQPFNGAGIYEETSKARTLKNMHRWKRKTGANYNLIKCHENGDKENLTAGRYIDGFIITSKPKNKKQNPSKLLEWLRKK